MAISNSISRRAAFLGMGALSVGTVAPVVAAARGPKFEPLEWDAEIADAGTTPVMKLFRRWQQVDASMTDDISDDAFEALGDVRVALERQMVATAAQGAEDILAKLVAYTNYGKFTIDSGSECWGAPILHEAKAFVTGKALA